MQLRLKIFLLSIVPMARPGGDPRWWWKPDRETCQQARDLVESTYLASRKARAASLCRAGAELDCALMKRPPTPGRQAEAKAILARA